MVAENSQQRLAWQVAFGEAPTKGSRAMPQSLDFTIGNPITVSLAYEQDAERIEFVQTMYIDNSLNPASLSITFGGTNQKITLPPASQAYVPVLADASQFLATFVTTGTPVIPVQYLSFPMPAIIWNINSQSYAPSGGVLVSGDSAAGVTDTGNPVKVGGVASTAPPAAVTAGQRANAWFNLNGAEITAPTTVAGGGDASASLEYFNSTDNSNSHAAAVIGHLYSGAGYDRARSNTDLTLLASAARTSTTASPDQTNFNGRGVRVVINITVNTSVAGFTPAIQGKDSISGVYYQIGTSLATIGAAGALGTFVYDIYPGASTTAAGGLTAVINSFLSRTWRINMGAGDANTATYSVSAVTIL